MELFFAADHDDRTLQIACRASAFLLPETDNLYDRGWSYVASCSRGNSPDAHCTPGNPEPRVALTPHSSSERRTDTASAILGHIVLPPYASDPSFADACTCSATSGTSL
jgi:hypothetical protein